MLRCPLVAAAKIRVPDRGMSSFLGDTNYYSPLGAGTQFPWPPELGTQEASLGQQPKTLGYQMCVKAPPGWCQCSGAQQMEVQRWCQPVPVPRECPSRLPDAIAKLDAYPSGLLFNTSR